MQYETPLAFSEAADLLWLHRACSHAANNHLLRTVVHIDTDRSSPVWRKIVRENAPKCSPADEIMVNGPNHAILPPYLVVARTRRQNPLQKVLLPHCRTRSSASRNSHSPTRQAMH